MAAAKARQITVVRAHNVRRHAEGAIQRRLRYDAQDAIISVGRDRRRRGAVLLHVNSDGNAAACRTALRLAGYQVEDNTDDDPGAPGHCGVQLWVLPSAARPVSEHRSCGDLQAPSRPDPCSPTKPVGSHRRDT